MCKSTQPWCFVICAALILVSGGCKKEMAADTALNQQSLRAVVTRPFKMTSETWYRISPTVPAAVPGIPNHLSFANVPGGGTGNATHMGHILTWFNQLAYSPNGQNPPSGTVAAPVLAAINYPVLFPGAPLPLIQPGDFEPLATANSWLNIPAVVDGYYVWTVIYNDKGDAVFLSATSASTTIIESPTRINFSGEGRFAGGRRKFENATGTYQFTGYFNPQDANDAGFSVEGAITF